MCKLHQDAFLLYLQAEEDCPALVYVQKLYLQDAGKETNTVFLSIQDFAETREHWSCTPELWSPLQLEQPHYSKEWTFCARSHLQLCIKHTPVQTCSLCALWRGFSLTRPSNPAAASPIQKLTLQLHSPGFMAEPLAEKPFGKLKHLYSARVKSKHTCIAELPPRWDQNCMWFHNRVKIGTEWSHAKSKASPSLTQGSKGGGGINMWREGRNSHSPSHKCRAATFVSSYSCSG